MNLFKKLSVLLLTFAAAGCSVSASGQVPCVDDSSCPSDYPVCTAGKCVAGTSSAAASVAIVGVPGKAPTDPLRGTVTVQVSARAASGVKAVALSAGSKSFSPAAGATGPVFSISVDTTTLTDGTVNLTATLTPGDATASVVTATGSIVVDNTPPTLSGAILASADIKQGGTVALDVTASEPLASISGTVSQGSTSAALADATTSGNTHRLIATLPASSPAGVYSISVNAADLAGNTASLGGAPSVTVHAPFTLTSSNLTLSAPALTTSGTQNITVTIPSGVVLASGAKPSVTFGPAGAATAALTVGGSSSPFTASYTVAGTEADGLYEVDATVTDIAGNVATFKQTFTIDKTPPAIPGGIVLTTPVAGPLLPASFNFSLSQPAATLLVTVNGHSLTVSSACTGAATTHVTCTYTPSDAADFTPAGSLLITNVPVSVTAKDALGNATTVGLPTATPLTFNHQTPSFTLSSDGVSGANANQSNTMLTVNATSSEALSSSTAAVVSGTSCPATAPTSGSFFSDITAPAGNTRHLGFAVTTGVAPGAYSLCLYGTDLANNPSATPPAAIVFHVWGGFSFSTPLNLTSPGSTQDAQGFPLVSDKTGHKLVSGSLTLPISGAQLGSNTPQYTLTFFNGSTGSVSGNGTTSPSYTVQSTDPEGLAVITATLADVAGNSATTSAVFDIVRMAPTANGILITPNTASVKQGFLLTFSTSAALSTSLVNASVGTNQLSCDGSTAWSCGNGTSNTPYKPAVTDPATVSLTVSDIVGNKSSYPSLPYTNDTTQPNFLIPAPVLGAASGVTAGTTQTLCLCPSKPLNSLTGAVEDPTLTSIGAANSVTGAPACSGLAACGTAWQELSFVMPTSAATGTYTFSATGTDSGGLSGAAAPTFTVNGSFSIKSLAISQNPTTLNGAQAFMGGANAGQYNCTVSGTTQGGTNGDITVSFDDNGNTLMTPLDSTGGVTVKLTDSQGAHFTLLGTATNPSGHTIQLKTCIPATASGYAGNAADGIATLSVSATSSSNNASNALNANIFIKSTAPQITGTPTGSPAIVGPAQTTLGFTFGLTETPASTTTFSFVLPGSAPDNATNGTKFNCGAVSGTTDSCSQSLSGADTASTSGSFASPATVHLYVTMVDAVGNKSLTGPIDNVVGYDGSTVATGSLAVTSVNPAVANTTVFNGTTASPTFTLTSAEDIGNASAFQVCSGTSPGACAGLVANTVKVPCGASTPCVITLANAQSNASAHTAVTYHLRVTPSDNLGNPCSTLGTNTCPLDITGAGATFTLDQTQPAFSFGTFTVKDTENGQSCSDTSGAFTNCNGTPVSGVSGQHLVFSGTAAFPGGNASSLSAATMSVGSTACGGSSCGTTPCTTSGANFTCTLTLNGAGATGTTANIATSFTLTDNLGNQSGSLTGPHFSLGNATETVTSVLATNDVTGSSATGMYVGGGVLVKVSATSNRPLASASISTTNPPNLPAAGTSSCSVTGTSINCSLVVSATATAKTDGSGSITVQGVDLNGNVGTASSQGFNVNVTPPTLGTLSPPANATFKDGVPFTLTSTPTTFNNIGLFSATVSGVAGGSGIGSVTGSCTTGVSCTVTTSGCSSSPCGTNGITVTAVDNSGMSLAAPKLSANFVVDDRAPAAGTLSTSTTLPLVTGASPNHVALSWTAMSGSANCTAANQCSITSSADPGKSLNVTSNGSGNYTTISTACTTNCLPDPTQSTVYTLNVTGSGGQTTSSSVSVGMAPVITTFSAPAVVTTGSNNVTFSISVTGVNCTTGGVCTIARSDGANLSLNGTGAFGSNVYTNSTLQATASAGGVTYALSVTDANSVTVTRSITVQVVPAPSGTLTLTSPSTGQFTTNASPVFSYSVSDGACGTAGNCTINTTNCSGTDVLDIGTNGTGVTPALSSITTTTSYVLCIKNGATPPSSFTSAAVSVTQVATPGGVTFAMHTGSTVIGLAATGNVTFDVAATSGVAHAVISGGGQSTGDLGVVTTTQHPTLPVPGSTTTYTLTAQNAAQDVPGTKTLTATVIVADAIAQSSLASVRFGAASVRLPDGRVLITGGTPDGTLGSALGTGTIYDPNTGVFSDGTGNAANATFSLKIARAFHTATLFKLSASNYKVLLVGGNAGETSYEVVSIPPAGSAATSANDSTTANTRCGHTATLVPGKSEPTATHAEVFVEGGTDCSTLTLGTSKSQNTTELWTDGNAATAAQKPTTTEHVFATATVLPDNSLMIAGGGSAHAAATNKVQIYGAPFDANATPNAEFTMQAARTSHTATLLQNGKVMLVGGAPTATTVANTTEIYTPSGSEHSGTNGTFASTNLPSLTTARADQAAVLLQNGMVLVLGGDDRAGHSFGSAAATAGNEVYDVGNNVFFAGPNMLNARDQFFAVPLSSAAFNSDGQIGTGGLSGELLVGGGTGSTSPTPTEALILP